MPIKPRLSAFAALGLIAFSCEQRAGAQGTIAVGQPTTRERSSEPIVEGETCTRTDDCPRGARCFDGRCAPATRSYQGEVLNERGARSLANARYQEAADTYRSAERAYRDRQLPVPAHVSCGLARALTAVNDRGGAPDDQREATARALATCLATASPGSALGDQAVAGLASLADRGLDPAALDRTGGQLMTGRDPRPNADNTNVSLVFTGRGAGARGAFRDLIGNEATRREVTRCFLQSWSSSRQANDQGTLSVGYSRSTNDYDELAAPRLTVTAADIAAPQGDSGVPLHWLTCAAAAIQTAASAIRWPGSQERWSESVVINVGGAH